MHRMKPSTLHALACVQKAYSGTDAVSLLGYMLKRAKRPPKYLLGLAVISIVISLCWLIQPLSIAGALLFMASLEWLKRDAFAVQHADETKKDFIRMFYHRDQALRYFLFKHNLPKEISGDAQALDKIKQLLSQRQRVRHASLIIKNPAFTLFLAVLTMLFGAWISKAANASTQLLAVITGFTLLALVISAQVGLIWRTRSYKEEELAEFVLWAWAEAEADTESDT